MKKVASQGFIALITLCFFSSSFTVQAGGEGSGGGQVIQILNYPSNCETKLEYLDLIPDDALKNLQLITSKSVQNSRPDQTHGCTRKLLSPLKDNQRYMAVLEKLVDQFTKQLVQWQNVRFSVFFVLYHIMDQLRSPNFYETRFKLPQLKDGTRVAPEFQMQGAYFENGAAYFQSQILENLSDEAIEGLMIKEVIRNLNFTFAYQLPNEELEKATRFLAKGDMTSYLNCAFAKKSEEDHDRSLRLKAIHTIEEKRQALQFTISNQTDPNQKELLKQEDLKLEYRWFVLQDIERIGLPQLFPGRQLSGPRISREIMSGAVPEWLAVRFPKMLQEQESLKVHNFQTPRGKAWDVETGELIDVNYFFNDCK